MIAIEAHNITKTYRLYESPAQRLKEIVLRKPFHTEFTALEQITFSVMSGETFGIIGENGAGKSTLLKILARTLKPTSGDIAIHGRTAALLELGAAFNPELSGEENIYLNAYLMGLSKGEVEDKKKDIIDFSELGDFIKRPVKTYSSGMHVRLAFAIATCVDPEILIIDEALSVGDQHFQKKCIDKMMQFRKEDKTIFFCSHSLYLVQELCNRTLWLKNGRMEKFGKTPEVINAYNDFVREREAGFEISRGDAETVETRPQEKSIWIESAKLTDKEGRELDTIKTGQDVWVRVVVHKSESAASYKVHIGIGLNRNDDEPVFGVTTKMDGLAPIPFNGRRELRLGFPSFPLLSGQYYMVIILADEYALHPFDTFRTDMFFVQNFREDLGIVRLEHKWEIEGIEIKEDGS